MGTYGRGTSGWGAGCGAFGLVGILISIGIAAYLSSEVAKNTSDVDGLTGALGGEELVVTVSPRSNLAEGQEVRVIAQGVPVASSYVLRMCGRSPDGKQGCDPRDHGRVSGDQHGRYEAMIPVSRILQTDAGAWDCAATGATCDIRISTMGSEAPIVRFTLRFKK